MPAYRGVFNAYASVVIDNDITDPAYFLFMDRIIINVVDRKTEYVKRIVLDVKARLTNCDFITLGEDIIFDRDTDFLTFGYDINGRMNQIAIVTGEGHDHQGKALVEAILAAVKGFEKVSEDESQIWLREA